MLFRLEKDTTWPKYLLRLFSDRNFQTLLLRLSGETMYIEIVIPAKAGIHSGRKDGYPRSRV